MPRKTAFEELIKKGYVQRSDGRKIWDIANRSLLYMTKDLAEAFLRLQSHPRYKATIVNIEMELLEKVAKDFLFKAGSEPFNLIDISCGNGKKAASLMSLLQDKVDINYLPVSSGSYLVNVALENVRKENFQNVKDAGGMVANLDDFQDLFKNARSSGYMRNVILLLGSVLASYDLHEYLFNLTLKMSHGDSLIIGNAIRTGDRFSNIENYKHPLFPEWFGCLMSEMGFEDGQIEYDARFENGRVECFYTLKENVVLDFEGQRFEFKKGDEVIVAVLYKYYEQELLKFCKMYFREVELLKDRDGEQAIVVCKK